MSEPTEMVLRVAKALHEQANEDRGLSPLKYLEAARAAIRAMLKPDREMCGVAYERSGQDWGDARYLECYQAMISSALGEE